eukprot:CAMPEP_0181168804 /NCGR_PEP_ID=MMETSP1096-20121128/473_1 /TAXON_ID=156174 ORGANISM="Chrysochromulina ericina, Strain CCMP281" /NCGR_SAMPLE_ID=MMETSP1096 /ASSEMBLY_ACC=CAM_ASM_000453 /LENGTH=124 /DNA_ID=CAMNT_0023256213 /DNA_START=181 /DNA_END=555 /DNA_ORIENTATION=+
MGRLVQRHTRDRIPTVQTYALTLTQLSTVRPIYRSSLYASSTSVYAASSFTQDLRLKRSPRLTASSSDGGSSAECSSDFFRKVPDTGAAAFTSIVDLTLSMVKKSSNAIHSLGWSAAHAPSHDG